MSLKTLARYLLTSCMVQDDCEAEFVKYHIFNQLSEYSGCFGTLRFLEASVFEHLNKVLVRVFLKASVRRESKMREKGCAFTEGFKNHMRKFGENTEWEADAIPCFSNDVLREGAQTIANHLTKYFGNLLEAIGDVEKIVHYLKSRWICRLGVPSLETMIGRRTKYFLKLKCLYKLMVSVYFASKTFGATKKVRYSCFGKYLRQGFNFCLENVLL